MADLKNIGAVVTGQFRGLNGRPPGQWPLVPRLMLGLGVLLMVLVAAWFIPGLGSSLLDELNAGEQKELDLRAEYTTKVAQANNLEALRKQKEQVLAYVSTLEKALPSKSEMDALLSEITHAGLGHGLQFEYFRPGQPVVKPYYAELPIDIKVTGSYNDIGAFSSDIANMKRIVTLNNLALSVGTGKDGGVLTLDTVAKTFRYLDQNEIMAQAGGNKKSAGGGKK